MKINESYDKGQITGLLSPLLESLRLNQIKNYIVGENILDFGCGYGKLASHRGIESYVGVDIDDDVIDLAKIINNEHNNSRFYYLKEFETTQLRFDAIILSAVIEHVEDPVQTLLELKRRLIDGGRIIITTPTPNANKILWVGSKLKLFSKKGLEDHKHMLTKQDLIDIAIKTNLDVELYKKFELGLNQIIIYRR